MTSPHQGGEVGASGVGPWSGAWRQARRSPGPWSCSGAAVVCSGVLLPLGARRAAAVPGSPRSCLGGRTSAGVRGHRARWRPCRSTSRRASGPGTRSGGCWSCALSRGTRPASAGGCKQGAQRHRRGLARAAGGLPSDCVSEGWRWPGASGYTPRVDGYGTQRSGWAGTAIGGVTPSPPRMRGK